MSVEVRRKEGSTQPPKISCEYWMRGLLVAGSCAVSRGDEAVAAQELRHARSRPLYCLAGVAKALAHQLAVLPLRLDDVLEPLAGKGDRALLGVTNGVGDRVVDPRGIRRPLGPAAANFEPIAVALAGALDEAAGEAVVAVGGAADHIEDTGLALENGLAQPVTRSSCLAGRGHD